MILEQVSQLSDGDYEQSIVVQLFVDCVDRATASSTAFVSFQEQPMHFKDNQIYEYSIRLEMKVFGQSQTMGVTVVATAKSGDKIKC